MDSQINTHLQNLRNNAGNGSSSSISSPLPTNNSGASSNGQSVTANSVPAIKQPSGASGSLVSHVEKLRDFNITNLTNKSPNLSREDALEILRATNVVAEYMLLSFRLAMSPTNLEIINNIR